MFCIYTNLTAKFIEKLEETTVENLEVDETGCTQYVCSTCNFNYPDWTKQNKSKLFEFFA